MKKLAITVIHTTHWSSWKFLDKRTRTGNKNNNQINKFSDDYCTCLYKNDRHLPHADWGVKVLRLCYTGLLATTIFRVNLSWYIKRVNFARNNVKKYFTREFRAFDLGSKTRNFLPSNMLRKNCPV